MQVMPNGITSISTAKSNSPERRLAAGLHYPSNASGGKVLVVGVEEVRNPTHVPYKGQRDLYYPCRRQKEQT